MKQENTISRGPFSFLVVLLIAGIVLFEGIRLKRYLHNEIINHDVVSYYAYLPALFIYHDLSFSFTHDLPPGFRGRIWTFTSPNGRATLKMPLGEALLLLPFFLVAHLLALTGMGPADGYAPVYQFFILLAAVFYLATGLFFLRKVLLAFFSDGVTALTLLLLVLATNLFYYAAVEPGMSHVYGFSLFAVFFWFSWRGLQSPRRRYLLPAGLVAGLILVVRPSDVLVLLVPLLYGWGKEGRAFWRRWRDHRRTVLEMIVMMLLPVLLQVAYWKYSTGEWFFYSYGEEGFFFLHPHIVKGLFSYRKGWLLYTPLMALALAGFPWLFQKDKALARAILVYLVLTLYVVFSWWCWWYGGGFGARAMIESYALLALPLAALLERIFKSHLAVRLMGGILLSFFLYLNLFQTRQYRITLLHWDSTSKALYWRTFLKNQWPEDYDQLLDPPDYEKALKGER